MGNDPFANINKARRAGASNPSFVKGTYLCAIDTLGLRESQKGQGAMVVLESTILEVIEAFEGSHETGDNVGRVFMIGQSGFPGEFALGELRELLGIVCGVPQAEVTSEHARNATQGDGQTMRGGVYGVRVVDDKKIDPKTGRPYPRLSYFDPETDNGQGEAPAPEPVKAAPTAPNPPRTRPGAPATNGRPPR